MFLANDKFQNTKVLSAILHRKASEMSEHSNSLNSKEDLRLNKWCQHLEREAGYNIKSDWHKSKLRECQVPSQTCSPNKNIYINGVPHRQE